MDVIHFISKFSEQIQLSLFAVLLLLCWNIENIRGIYSGYHKWRHAFINTPFLLTAFPVQLFLAIFLIKTIKWTGAHHFGVTYVIPNLHNSFLLFIVTFLLLDLGEYIYHRIMHKVKRFWMFHIVHHSDTIVDVSTTFREHPGETFIRLSFTLLWLWLTGCVFWIFALRQIIQVVSTVSSHMNCRLPEKVDRIIGWVFITPNLHHVHHHFKQPYTDSNYGDVLSIWDRLFGTFQRLSPQDHIVSGVDSCMCPKEIGNFKSLSKIPFGKYKRVGVQ